MGIISRGFGGRRQSPDVQLPPGQYLTNGFPVLSAGPTPRIDLGQWEFAITNESGDRRSWSWEEFRALPRVRITVDIHCVTKWSKLDTHWAGVSLDTLFAQVELDPAARYVTAFCDGGYTTNLPLSDVLNGHAFIAYQYEGQPLAPEHGGPARLVVPQLYFWKSAKWVRGVQLLVEDEPGFWESVGYHNYGDPWREQRYQGD